MSGRSMLLFAPALIFGVISLTSSALALGLGLGSKAGEEELVRNRVAVIVAVVAAVLCGVALVVGGAWLIVDGLAEATAGD